MNMLTAIPNGLTMSSREIADRTGKRHDNVMRDARVMPIALHGAANLLRFEGVYRDAKGEERPIYNLPKRETLILVSGYSVTMRAAIIDRWQEPEAQQAPRIPTHVEALRLAVGVIEETSSRVLQHGWGLFSASW
ncbi:Rha family transcriptional regulator [Methylobacterium sp. Leaf465]|uniref:Rha family transcriptional regulator n=1 Tax=Methylobacterium sp. Leaf465 TaxID=1736385 RepID=UPI000B0DF986|nr:Rha family transcriptional regulator [Methylobacterium sp. Leaf465]